MFCKCLHIITILHFPKLSRFAVVPYFYDLSNSDLSKIIKHTASHNSSTHSQIIKCSFLNYEKASTSHNFPLQKILFLEKKAMKLQSVSLVTWSLDCNSDRVTLKDMKINILMTKKKSRSANPEMCFSKQPLLTKHVFCHK